jgi:hypothetical protein
MDLWSLGFTTPNFSEAEPWGNGGFSPAPLGWQFADHGIQFFVERDPNFNVRTFDANSPIGVQSEEALRLFDRRTEKGDGDQPAKLLPFIAEGRKMLIYHGLSDPALPAFRTINHYEAVSNLVEGGIRELQENVRLFLVPGMHHCSGGPGPNSFDTLTALENWVEHGQAPDSILATHFKNNSAAQGVDRTMPLCKFPEQATYKGTGDVNDAANWRCDPKNKEMLKVGLNGRLAGAGQHHAHRVEGRATDLHDRGIGAVAQRGLHDELGETGGGGHGPHDNGRPTRLQGDRAWPTIAPGGHHRASHHQPPRVAQEPSRRRAQAERFRDRRGADSQTR